MSKIYLLSSQNFDGVENLEVFEIRYLPKKIEFSKYDALIITSKNAIFSLNSFNDDWKKIPCFAIAEKTANEIKNYGGNLFFTGNSGHGNDFANEIKDKLKGKKAIYLRAKKVVSNLIDILKDNSIDIHEEIIYETVCKNLNKDIEKNSIIIFTSPSSIKCFFKSFKWDNSFKAIVIGKTTAKYLPSNVKYIISPQTSMEECIKLAQMDSF